MKRFIADLRKRFNVRGVFWRQLINWGVQNVPSFMEPHLLAVWAFILFVGWGHGRRSVRENLRVISPPANWFVLTFRAYRVFWNFAWTFDDTTRFNVERMEVDWVLDPLDTFDELARDHSAAIIVTAHMGNYDLGSYLFTSRLGRSIVIVRAAEVDAATDAVAREHRRDVEKELGKIRYVQPSSELAMELVAALQDGDSVAIQGDRVIEGVATSTATFFGRRVELPAGPFALAMASQKRIVPIFVIRTGRRRYRVLTGQPFVVTRTSRDRQKDIDRAVNQWAQVLESVVREHWYQWFPFYPYFPADEQAA